MKLEVGKKYLIRNDPECMYAEIVYKNLNNLNAYHSCCALLHYKHGQILEIYMENGRYSYAILEHPKDLIAEYTEPNDKVSQLKSCVDNLAKQIDEIKASLSKL